MLDKILFTLEKIGNVLISIAPFLADLAEDINDFYLDVKEATLTLQNVVNILPGSVVTVIAECFVVVCIFAFVGRGGH